MKKPKPRQTFTVYIRSTQKIKMGRNRVGSNFLSKNIRPDLKDLENLTRWDESNLVVIPVDVERLASNVSKDVKHQSYEQNRAVMYL